MDNLYQLQNASAVMRSCEAMGVQDVHLITRNPDLKHERGIAMGSAYWLSVHRHEGDASNRRAIEQLKAQGYRLVATSPHADGLTLGEARSSISPPPSCLARKKPGLTTCCSRRRTPTCGSRWSGLPSFNVSVSVALCLHELLPKLRASAAPWRLSPGERERLALAWARRRSNMSRRSSSALRRSGMFSLERFIERLGDLRLLCAPTLLSDDLTALEDEQSGDAADAIITWNARVVVDVELADHAPLVIAGSRRSPAQWRARAAPFSPEVDEDDIARVDHVGIKCGVGESLTLAAPWSWLLLPKC